MSGSTANTQSVVVQRLCALFGKEYNEVSAAIQTEMTAMEHELQCWKLQLVERGESLTTTAEESKKTKKPRANAKKSAPVAESSPTAESSADGSAATDQEVATDKPAAKKAPAKPRANAKKAAVAVVESSSSSSAEIAVVEGETQQVVADESPKTEKKAPAKPRAKKAVAVAESATEGGETQQQPAAKSSPKTAKKAAAKKATNVVDNSESVSVEKKATKPRAKKVVEAVAAPAAVAEIQLVTEETQDFVEVEVEVEVSEFEFGGVQYLRAKDNKLYDPETSEVVGMWNEETSAIDKCDEEIEVEQAD